MPVELDALGEWGVGNRMLSDMLRGKHPDDAAHAEWRRGVLPPGRLGVRKASEIRDRAAELALEAHRYRGLTPRLYDVDIELRNGRRLTGTIPRVYHHRLVEVSYSKLGPKQLIAAWIRLLTLAAGVPGGPWSAVCIGRFKNGKRTVVTVLDPPTDPTGVLESLIGMYDRGRAEPLPLPVKTAFAWAQARFGGDDPRRTAEYQWRGGRYPGEDVDDAYARVWGARAGLDVLLGPPRPGEEMAGESTRLGALAARLWQPVLLAERGES